jgi:ligand-binding SRPBCC domain-containing protein
MPPFRQGDLNTRVITLHLETLIAAPRERVFDLARSIDVHQATTTATGEKAVEGVTSGLLGPGQQVTWQARHFGVVQRLCVKMTRFDRPAHFQDVMVTGAFRSMKHDHYFEETDGQTIMRDRFQFAAPLGPIGWLAERLFLARYMRRFLEVRNATLKHIAESDDWQKYLAAGAEEPT